MTSFSVFFQGKGRGETVGIRLNFTYSTLQKIMTTPPPLEYDWISQFAYARYHSTTLQGTATCTITNLFVTIIIVKP